MRNRTEYERIRVGTFRGDSTSKFCQIDIVLSALKRQEKESRIWSEKLKGKDDIGLT